jgi:hypothetical protein
MRTSRGIVGSMVLLFATAAAGRAAAQPSEDRVRISVDAGAQFSSIAFDTTATRVVYLENASINASYRVRRGLLADGGISVRIAGNVSVGVVLSSLMAKNDADVSAALPHPFFFKTPRSVTGTAAALRHDELAAHVQAIYIVHPGANFEVALSGGPSFFQVRQDVVTDIAFSDTYPYDAPAFTSAATQRVSANKIGFNAGADVGFRLSRHAGVGGGVRFSRAVVDLAVPNGGGTAAVDAGGAQVAGGLRLYF